MKGTLFQKPFEFILTTTKENWRQQESVEGTFTIKCHSKESSSINDAKVHLALGQFKKVREKDVDAFHIISTANITSSLTSTPCRSTNDSVEFNWKFDLTEDAPITDKNSSLFLLYGIGDDLTTFGQLQLIISMKKDLEFLLEVFEKFHRFKVHQLKYKEKEKSIEVKFTPPKSREMATINGLTCLIKQVEKDIIIKYNFDTNSLESANVALNLSVQKKKKVFEQTLSEKDYMVFGGYNYDKVKDMIDQILKEVRPKLLY